MDLDSDGDHDNLGTVAVILGLALFFVFVAVVLLRRLYLHKVNRLAQTPTPGLRTRVEFDNDDREPRFIALGARAALLRKPILWEDYLVPFYDMKDVEAWSHLQPMNLQLTTPHTTAHFPTKSVPSSQAQGPGRLRRLSYSHIRPYSVPHGTNTNSTSQPSNTFPTSTSPQRHSALAPISSIDSPSHDSKSQENASERCPHPVHVTFLISMPDPSSPSFSSTKSPPNTGLLSPYFLSYSKTSLNTQVPHLELGTTSPIVQLSSMPISQAELDSWWDLPAVSRRGGGQTMGRQTERERIRDILGFSFQNYP